MNIEQLSDAVSVGTPINTMLVSDDTCALKMGEFGCVAYRIMAKTNTTLTVSGGKSGSLQTMTIMIQQPPDGGAEITLPDGVIWANGSAPFVDSRAGAVTFITLMTPDGGKRYYGRSGF